MIIPIRVFEGRLGPTLAQYPYLLTIAIRYRHTTTSPGAGFYPGLLAVNILKGRRETSGIFSLLQHSSI